MDRRRRAPTPSAPSRSWPSHAWPGPLTMLVPRGPTCRRPHHRRTADGRASRAGPPDDARRAGEARRRGRRPVRQPFRTRQPDDRRACAHRSRRRPRPARSTPCSTEGRARSVSRARSSTSPPRRRRCCGPARSTPTTSQSHPRRRRSSVPADRAGRAECWPPTTHPSARSCVDRRRDERRADRGRAPRRRPARRRARPHRRSGRRRPPSVRRPARRRRRPARCAGGRAAAGGGLGHAIRDRLFKAAAGSRRP